MRQWLIVPPVWLRVQAPLGLVPPFDLDPGERDGIALALELRADRILLDEAKARHAALNSGLKVAGTLAVLFEASQRGLMDFRQTIDELRGTTFYLDEKLIQTVLDRIRDNS